MMYSDGMNQAGSETNIEIVKAAKSAAMDDRIWQIGLVGTFDVQNYGDLLFPLVAEAELSKRLGPVKLHRFSYHSMSPPSWPYEVTSVTELPQLAGSLDGLLIGGGFIIRFDQEIAAGYVSPSPAIHHPTGYWLAPALIALQEGIPLIWNAPGMHCNKIPAWAEPLLRLSLKHSSYVAVRDEPSQTTLARFSDPGRIALVPDTVFGITDLLDQKPSAALESLRKSAGLSRPYIIIQAALGLEAFSAFVKKYARRLQGFQIVVLPVSPALGDDVAIIRDDLPQLVRLPTLPHPLVVAELISQAEAVVGHSYHLAITALASGVPVFTPQDLTTGKYSALADFEKIFPLPVDGQEDIDSFIARVGRSAPSANVGTKVKELARHWDRVAAELRAGSVDRKTTLNLFWQSLPGLLEQAATRDSGTADICKGECAEKQKLTALLSLARAEIVAQDNRIAAFSTSRSWKLTSPLRFIGDLLRGKTRGDR